jgi:acyl carrier protein
MTIRTSRRGQGAQAVMAKTSGISNKIISALADYLKRDPASIKPSYHLREDLGLDSMAVIELLYRIEEAFNLQIPDEDLADLTTVAHVVAYVERRLSPSASSAAKSGKPRSTKGKKA